MRCRFAIVILISACTPLPDLGNTMSDAPAQEGYPALIAVETLAEAAAARAARPADAADAPESIQARRAALQARAARLRTAPKGVQEAVD